jgi:hypothetical protein
MDKCKFFIHSSGALARPSVRPCCAAPFGRACGGWRVSAGDR